MSIINEKWNDILLKVKEDNSLTDISYNTWLKPLCVNGLEDQVLYVIIPEQAYREVLNKKYAAFIKKAIISITGIECEISFIMEDEAKHITSSVSKNKNNMTGINARYTFDTFVVGSNNKFAHAASLAVAESPGEIYNPLFIYGGAGLGKTHLMHSIANFIHTTKPDNKVFYVASEDFTNEIVEAIKNKTTPDFREKYRDLDVLLIDDVQFIIGRDSTQNEFFQTFNALYTAGKQIIISSDRPPKDLEILDERITSRFECGLMADIKSPDYETRIAILKKKQELDGFYVSDEVIKYIATNITSNIRKLEGSLTKVIAVSRFENKPADLTLAKTALKDYIEEKKVITPEFIISEVANYFNITAEDIKSDKRSSNISYPRQIAIYLIINLTNTTQDNVGKAVGGKDHSTVIYAINKVKSMIQENEEVRKTVEKLKEIIS